MHLPHHRRLFGCEWNLECVASSLQLPAFLLVRQALIDLSGTTGNDNVQRAGFTFSKAMEEQDLKRRSMLWKTLDRFPIMQTFPFHELNHLSTLQMEYALYG